MPVAGRAHIVVAAALFGTTGTSQALADVNAPLAVGAARIMVGGVALVAIAFAARTMAKLRRHPWLVCASAIGVAVYQLAFFAAVETTGVAIGTVVAIGVGPIAAGAFEWVLSRTRQTWQWAAATATAAVGVAVLALGAGSSGVVDASGVVLAIVAGVGYALYIVIAKRLLDEGCEPTGVMAAAFGGGALVLIPIMFVQDVSWLSTSTGWALVLYLGLVPTALAYILYAMGLRRISAGEAATITLLEPATATLLGMLVLGERPGVAGAVGIVLIGVAMVILLRPPSRRAVLSEAST